MGENGIAEAKQHWLEFGISEKRIKSCSSPMTDKEATCYINRYEDLAGYKKNPVAATRIK